MKAAIYARKSTDDNDRNEENKSITRQVEHAKAFATKKGWTVDNEHVFTDDGISGAEFERRPGLLRMLDRLKDFDVIVMSELSRLGREQSQTNWALAKIISKGRRMFFYLTDEELKYESAVDKFLVHAVTFAAELEREKASQRSRDALERKARHGYNSGGRVYGYDNVPVYGTNGDGARVRTHTDYKINKQEANIVQRIFRMYSEGHGHTKIAKSLNGDPDYRALSKKYFDDKTPPSPWKGTGSWDPSSIRAMLYRERYTGKVPFGEYRKKLKKRVRQAEFILVERPELRIIEQPLWDRVQKRLKAVRENYIRDTNGNWWGRPETGSASHYLLSRIARCESCGHNIVALSGGTARGEKISYYQCSYHHNRGSTVCTNDHRERIERVDGPVIEAIEQQILMPNTDRILEHALQMIAERRKQGTPDKKRKLEVEIRRLERELRNLTALVIDGDAPKTIRQEIAVRESRLEQLNEEFASYVTPTPSLSELDERRVRKAVQAQAARFRELLRGNVTVARQVLHKLLHGPIHFVPEVRDGRKTYRFYGETKLGPLLDPAFINMASPRGFEPLLPP